MHDTALIVIDMINPYELKDAELLSPSVREALPAMRHLVTRARETGVEVSALDAHIRHLTAVVPPDAVAHIRRDLADAALQMMERNMNVEICAANEVRL
ncbi:hypothetical protein [Streptomyces sp. NPDC005336]|uniref:hypothetical protein n=1 Tax=Streptomyces sp. NPDC005336 TaxID=3157035 RepID=UPI0033B1F071